MNAAIRIGALISGGGTNLQAIIDACESGAIDGRMVFVGSDNPSAGGLDRARHHGIPHFVVDYRRHPPASFAASHRKSRLPEDFNLLECQAQTAYFPERCAGSSGIGFSEIPCHR